MSGPARMTIEERFSRDGDRWRYIYYLERALEQQRIRRRALLFSLALNAILAIALLQLVVSP